MDDTQKEIEYNKRILNYLIENFNDQGNLIADQVDISKVTLDAKLKQDWALDSLDQYSFGFFIEDLFDIAMEDYQMQRFETVADCIEYIKKEIRSTKNNGLRYLVE